MLFDRSEFEPAENDPEAGNEPEEYDPEADLYDPNSDSLTIPSVETTETDASPELVKTFWLVVIAINIGIIGVVVGPILYVFDGDPLRSIALIIGGIVLFALAYFRYKSFMESPSSSTSTTETDDPDSPPESSNPTALADPNESHDDSQRSELAGAEEQETES